VLAVPFLVLAIVSTGEDKLSFTQITDGDVTIVTITGPRALLERAAEFTEGQVARGKACNDLSLFQVPGFGVHWGDDQGTYVSPLAPVAEGCPDQLRHVYAVPGTYQITAGLYHLGPDDGPVSEWRDKTSITIEGKEPPLALSITEPWRDEIMYRSRGVTVRWTLSTPKPVDLLVEIIGRDGAVLGSRSVQGLKYAGEGELLVYYDEDPYWRHLLDETAPVDARVHVQEDGRDLLLRESPPFRVIGQIDPRHGGFEGVQVERMPDRTVQVRQSSLFAGCYPYRIEWGDGSPYETYPATTIDAATGQCRYSRSDVVTMHTYQQAGTYTIVLRMDYTRRSLDNAPYDVFHVDVR
jgi:hypothetical protein